MKKHFYLLTAVCSISALTVAAAEPDCSAPPSCKDLGYIDKKNTCPGDYAVCPFNFDEVLCILQGRPGDVMHSKHRNKGQGWIPADGGTVIKGIYPSLDKLFSDSSQPGKTVLPNIPDTDDGKAYIYTGITSGKQTSDIINSCAVGQYIKSGVCSDDSTNADGKVISITKKAPLSELVYAFKTGSTPPSYENALSVCEGKGGTLPTPEQLNNMKGITIDHLKPPSGSVSCNWANDKKLYYCTGGSTATGASRCTARTIGTASDQCYNYSYASCVASIAHGTTVIDWSYGPLR